MHPLHWAALKSSARSTSFRVRVSGARARLNHHAQRNSSHSTNSGPVKDTTSPRPRSQNTIPPHSLHQVPVGETSKPVDPVDIPIQLWYHRLGPVSTFFQWFHRTQLKRPYTVQLCTTLTTYLCGDILAQDIGGEPYNPWRTLRMLTIGALAAIPGYKWFLFLGQSFNYPSKIASIATKVAVNQIVFTPVFNTYFFGMQALLTGEHTMGIIMRIQAAVPISMLNSLKLWPAVTAFSFAFVPPQYRFMFSGVFAVAWQCYLSFLNRTEEKIEAQIDTLSRPVLKQSMVTK
ncbi:hypothetical protein AYO21_05173 [Fonsecaea monophora]|uniref:Protein SYM1 n=2 Tax=Fonsecaea TaxID=40354 RepID=A0A0D2E1S3_9EURO|nr:uncharacterized protein Z517_03212 [Fonsecaea pedrosoi CBS 271.37]XP_022512629.1 hypothetical protein AYO21_05173 [Fonsecaea monophora]KAH0832491.1 integral membrane protein, Mpv17/PMP22 family [Fonsecaea pedrosoi]KIW83966.1 hypothetical protein Z517_03212 [Fonsecaea pedrosoi CBS 271.37]OAG40677.1 hypothetical protein AYO21_05173 [Fonsecaea monophora]